MQRKLASIQRVLSVFPIVGADAIEAVLINGWQCVVKKNTFKVGDRGVFFEIDAVPPDAPAYRFLWMKPNATELTARPARFRIRTRTMRGCLSQGLFMPAADVGVSLTDELVEGTDLTVELGVTKYEPPLPTGSASMGNPRDVFPRAVPRTDEERIQSAPELLNELRGLPYVATLKCDGTSSTYLVHPEDGEFHACGRNWSITDGDNLYWNVARKHDLEQAIRRLDGRYALQGEICGPGIQGNLLGLKEPTFLLFSIYDLETRRYVGDAEMRRLAVVMGVAHAVPVVEEGENFQHTQDSLLALAEGLYPGTKNQREGIVIRPREARYSPTLRGALSFKAISNRFLLGEKD